MLKQNQVSRGQHWIGQPLRALLWIGLAAVVIFAVQWMITSLKPDQGSVPARGPTPVSGIKEDNPRSIQVEPVLSGSPSLLESWSPDGEYFFTELLEPATPGGDRRTSSLHFISKSTGEDCPASQTFLGPQNYQNTAWLDNQRVLFIDKQGQAVLFSACQPGSEDISSRFGEPLLRAAVPIISSGPAAGGPLLLQGQTAFWVLNPETLDTRPVDGIVPSSDLTETFARRPGSQQMAVIQQVPGDAGLSRITLVDLNSGEVVQQVEAAGRNGTDPMHSEWMGPDHLLVWAMDSAGPLMIDFSAEPASQVRVLPELMGLNLAYPDQVFSTGAYYSDSSGAFHIIVYANLAEDQSIYIYHSENNQVEHLVSTQPVLLILPDDQRMPLIRQEDEPIYEEGYQLIWVDAPGKPQGYMPLAGHTPRNSTMLGTRLLPGSQGLLVSSSRGISLAAIPGGETLAFWQLSGAGDASGITMSLSPDGTALIAVARMNTMDQGDLVYWLPITN